MGWLLCCGTDFCLKTVSFSLQGVPYSSDLGKPNKPLLPSFDFDFRGVNFIFLPEWGSLTFWSESEPLPWAYHRDPSAAQPRGPGPGGLPSSWPSARFPGDWDSGLVGFRCLCFTLTPLCSFPESEAPLGLFLVGSWGSLGGFRHCREVKRVSSGTSLIS